jgi:putative transposase
LSRGNNRKQVFHSADEYDGFVKLLDKARADFGVDVFAFCIMPNHFHLVVQVEEVARLSDMVQWWLTTHATLHHLRHGTSGHVWQGRFKSFPIQADDHLLTVLRYVLLNPCRASLAAQPWDWAWSSLHFGWMIKPWPVQPSETVNAWLEAALSPDDVAAVKQSVQRGTPFGDERWRTRTAKELGLQATLHPVGRPRKAIRPDALVQLETASFDF